MHLINTTKSYPAVGPYSQAVRVGDAIYFSGVIGIDPHTGTIAPDTLAQTEQIFANIIAIMGEVGVTLCDVIKTTCFLTDMGDFVSFNEIYAKHFGDHHPTRSTVGVTSLPKGAKVEIDMIAHTHTQHAFL